ncbi:Na+/H+ antiporter NhaC [Gottschalkiaceae bacterium SANA]|nr:Na+/H+ antiporter NhaC [Gottschalkiaceae bacterium SANA]
MKKQMGKRAPSKIEAFSTMLILLASVGFGAMKGLSAIPFLMISTVWVCLIGLRCGYSWNELEEGMVEKAKTLAGTTYILITIGFIIGTWMFSGTIPVMVYYLLNIINPSFIIVLSFIISAVVAAIIGTSWGTAGTVGVVMISLANAQGVSMPMVAGAVVSGVHIGQILSPMSDMSNLATTEGNTDVMSVIRRCMRYAAPTILFCIVVYTLFGFTGSAGVSSLEQVSGIKNQIAEYFNTSPLVLLPLVLLVFLSIKKIAVLPTMILSGLTAVMIGMIMNNFDLSFAINTMYRGFNISTIATAEVSPILQSLTNRGGMMMMSGAIVMMFTALAFAGAIIKIGALQVIVETLFSKIKSKGGLALATVSTGLVTALATSDSYMTLILPCDLMKKKYNDSGYASINVAAVSQSVGALIMGIIPWTSTAIYMSQVTGVPVLKYAPFAFFLWVTPIFAVLVSMLPNGFVKLTDEVVENNEAAGL